MPTKRSSTGAAAASKASPAVKKSKVSAAPVGKSKVGDMPPEHPGCDDDKVEQMCLDRAGCPALPASAFEFYIISKGRPENVPVMKAHFVGTGVTPTWIVGYGEVASYKAKGATKCVEGGKLTPSRNLALDLAAVAGKLCVQLSDDLSHMTYLESRDDGGAGLPSGDCWKPPPGSGNTKQLAANIRSYAGVPRQITPVGAARLAETFLRKHGSKLAGAYPCMNSGFSMNMAPVTFNLFIVGDFIVVDTRPSAEKADPSAPPLFNYRRHGGADVAVKDWATPQMLAQQQQQPPPPSTSSSTAAADAKDVKDAKKGKPRNGSQSASAVVKKEEEEEEAAALTTTVAQVKSADQVALMVPSATRSNNGDNKQEGSSHVRGLRFDERFVLKEDYDFTCQHIEYHGSAVRLNRLFVKALHRINPGGAVADRNSSKEKAMIKLLKLKWPGVFTGHRRKDEVMMNWRFRSPRLGDRVAKAFDGTMFRGEVVKYLPPTEDEDHNDVDEDGNNNNNDELWRVEYDDGDVEDLNRRELDAATIEAERLDSLATGEN